MITTMSSKINIIMERGRAWEGGEGPIQPFTGHIKDFTFIKNKIIIRALESSGVKWLTWILLTIFY